MDNYEISYPPPTESEPLVDRDAATSNLLWWTQNLSWIKILSYFKKKEAFFKMEKCKAWAKLQK